MKRASLDSGALFVIRYTRQKRPATITDKGVLPSRVDNNRVADDCQEFI